MSVIFIIMAVLFIFGVFATALAYGQIVTRGMNAPGARQAE